MTLAIRPSLAATNVERGTLNFPGEGHRTRPLGEREERYKISSGAKVTQRHQRSWSQATANVSDIQNDGVLTIEFDPAHPLLVMAIDEVGTRMDVRPVSVARAERKGHVRPGAISLLPKGFKARVRSPAMRYCRLFTLGFHQTRTESQRIDGAPGNAVFNARLMFVEPEVAKICQLLAQECVRREPNSAGYADDLVDALLAALAKIERTTSKAVNRGGLAPWQLRKIQDHMVENLKGRVTMLELAEIAQVSVTHLHRAFKVSAGCAPHQWLINARIEEAKRQLLSTEASITDISLGLGFCDQAHFTKLFTKWVGMTPHSWQKARI